MTAYIIKVILCSALLLTGYRLLLEKEKIHRFNRFFLLLALILPFIVPFLNFEIQPPVLTNIENNIPGPVGLDFTGNSAQPTTVAATNYLPSVLLMIYATVTIILLLRFLLNLRLIIFRIFNDQKIRYNNSTIVLIDEPLVPHSFLNYIFINRVDYKDGHIEQEILIHELTHVRQKHSLDILFLELLQVFCWLNPLLPLYRKAIRLNHEFLADEHVIDTCDNTTGYQYLLIDKAAGRSNAVLASQFNYSITKKRLVMMTKITSTRKAICVQMAIIPLLAIAITVFSTKTNAQTTPDTTKPPAIEVQSTKEGVSQELLNEYEAIINKAKDEKGRIMYKSFSDADKARLETIFLAMSKEQQKMQVVRFMRPSRPLPRVVPTAKQIEAWKDAKTYGLWINEKRVSNAVLDKYSNTDFAQVFVSKLSKNAVNYGKHYYQVDLMTVEYYDNYYKETIAEKRYYMTIRWVDKQTR
jgi:beta-lactamase regulating signal transducer with metallopeptidase domain